MTEEEQIELLDFVFIPAKETMTRKIKIKSIKKAKPIVFDENQLQFE
jgi:hypothetical protein